MATVRLVHTGGNLDCLDFLLFHQQVAPLPLIAKPRSPHAPISEIEEHGRLRIAGRLGAPDCVISFRCHTALFLIALGETSVLWAYHICASRGDTGLGRPCAAVACSFIALAAWVRQLPFWLLKSREVTECLQSGHLNRANPFIILMV